MFVPFWVTENTPVMPGDSCSLLDFLPGHGFLDDKPLCVYHGLDANSTSWGGSVLKAPEDGKYYMWVAEVPANLSQPLSRTFRFGCQPCSFALPFR